ncbi:MAG: DUF5666 domain-containing protein [Nitrospira sp.]
MVRHLLLATALILSSSTAWAHGSGQHVLGTVTAIDASHIEVKTPKGAAVSVKVTKQTRYIEKGNPKSTDLPTIGDRVVIEATKEKSTLTATEVHYSSAKKALAPAAPQEPAPQQ